jgi:hypothetical protein
MQTTDPDRARQLGAVAILSAAVWFAQCLLAPAALAPGRRWISAAAASILLLGLVLLSVRWTRLGRAAGPTLALIVAPAAVVASVAVWTRGVEFDPAARVFSALSASAYFAAINALRSASMPKLAALVRPAGATVTVPPPPPLRWVAWGCLLLGSASLGILGPAWLATRPGPLVGRGALASIGPARDALVSSLAIALALLWTVYAGPRWLRRAPPRPRQRSRAVAMIVWAVAFGALWWLLVSGR